MYRNKNKKVGQKPVGKKSNMLYMNSRKKKVYKQSCSYAVNKVTIHRTCDLEHCNLYSGDIANNCLVRLFCFFNEPSDDPCQLWLP